MTDRVSARSAAHAAPARRYSVWPVRDAELNNLCKLPESRPSEYLQVVAVTLPKRFETGPAD